MVSRIDRDEDANIREISIIRRDSRELPAIEVNDQTRICLNCRQAVQIELRAIEADPACARFNIVIQRSGRLCLNAMLKMI